MEFGVVDITAVRVVGKQGKPIDQVRIEKTKLFLSVQLSKELLDKSTIAVKKIAYCMVKRTFLGQTGSETIQIEIESPKQITLTKTHDSSNTIVYQIANPLPVSDIFPEHVKKRGFTPVVFVEISIQGRTFKFLTPYATSSNCKSSCFYPLDDKTYASSSYFQNANKKRKVDQNQPQTDALDQVSDSNSNMDFSEVFKSFNFNFQDEEPIASSGPFQYFCSSTNSEGRKLLSSFVGIPEPQLLHLKLNVSFSPYATQLYTFKAGESLQIRLLVGKI